MGEQKSPFLMETDQKPHDSYCSANSRYDDPTQPQGLRVECSSQIRFRHQFYHDEISCCFRMSLGLLVANATFLKPLGITQRIKG